MAEQLDLPSTTEPLQREARRALDQAIVAFRRGDPVLLSGDNGAVLAIAAEQVTEESLGSLRNMSSRRLSVVVTRRRAVALGLAPRSALAGVVRITVAPHLSAAVIRKLADPAASLGAEPPGLGPEPATAEPGALAAVTLAKLADLLPAALVLWLVPTEAALARRRQRSTKCARDPPDVVDAIADRGYNAAPYGLRPKKIPLPR